MNARMRGALLVIACFVLLVTGPEGCDVQHVAALLGYFVFGSLLLSGILGRSPRIRALQAEQRSEV